MSLRLVTPFVNTNIPGVYPSVIVQSQPVGLGLSGIVVIMGEADAGPGYHQSVLANQFFTPDQLANVEQLYGSGQIVDSFTALAAPSDDPNITGSANLIYIAKTNNGTQASSLVPAFSGTYGTFTAQNWGVGGNLFNYEISSLNPEVPPQLTGNTVPAFGAPLNGATFSIRLNGGAVDVITLSSSSGPVNPTEAAAAQTAAHSAYTSLNGMTATPISATLDGQTLTPGVYSTGAASLAGSGPGTLTFNGAGVYVIQVASTLVTGAGGTPTMTLSGGATAANIYWVVGSSATINSGFTGTFQGNVIASASITDTLGGTVNGSLIALSGAVTLSAPTLVNAQSAPLLGFAGSFGLLGASAVTGSASSGTTVTGNVGSSPTNTITNFPPGVIIGSTHSDIAELVEELNLLLPAGITASAGLSSNVILTMAIEAGSYANGFGQSFELFDSTPGDLAALGLTEGLYVSSEEPAVEVQILNASAGINQIFNIAPSVSLSVGYEGTSGTLTINATTLTTTVTGGSGSNLSIPLSQFTTIGDLATFINSQSGYSASANPSAVQLPPSALDRVTAIGIASSEASTQPGRIKNAAYLFQTTMGTSSSFSFTPNVFAGLPIPGTLTFLSGGTRGATLAADVINVLNQIGGINCNIIVPLFSEDASLDIAAGLTDPASTYTIAAVNAATKSHCIQYSTPSLKKNRICILSFLGTYANAKVQAQSLANYRCSLTMQGIMQVNSQGVIKTFQPWFASSLAAGMQAGGFYKSILNKAANLISFVDPSGFDSGSPGDVEDALSAGLLFLSKDIGRAGYWVSDQTTYGFDTNFVYNSIQAVYASDLIALDLAQSFFTQFVGQSLADVTPASALSFLTQKMDGYLKLKLIGSSSDAPLGFKNASITINAPEMDVAVEIKLATAIYFIPININVSQITGSAGV